MLIRFLNHQLVGPVPDPMNPTILLYGRSTGSSVSWPPSGSSRWRPGGYSGWRRRLIVYDAVALHYFAKHRDVVERILSSARLR
ncbi:MAG: hypothetical protein ACREMB_22405 [Candidatus Rokuibacteriota bacterium]